MTHVDPYGAGDGDLDGLPELPIPRPGEWSPAAAAPQGHEPRLASPALGGGLGGGASFTAAAEGEQVPVAASAHVPDEGVPVAADPASPNAERERVESERFTWDLAARLTSGLLANPARGNSSVKDAMGLFDQFLQEMHAYHRIASDFDLIGSDAERRRAHEQYFQQQRASIVVSTPGDVPGASQAPIPAGGSPKPEPAQPRPMADYHPIPPGARGPYSPGSMAGMPPPERQPGDPGEQAA